MPQTLAEYLAMPITWKRTRSETLVYQTRLNFSAHESEILSIRPVIMMNSINELWVNGERIGDFLNPPANWGADDGWLWLGKPMMLDVNDEVRAYLKMPLTWKKTYDVHVPARTTGPAGEKLELYMGSFPSEPFFTLMKNGWALGDFDDWPKCWKKS